MMKANDFIVENYPVTAKDFENKECAGLHDVAYICKKYHESEVKNLGLFSVSQLCELLFEFNEWVANDRRSTTVKQLVDGFIKEKFK